jgi:hypothetical protein
MTNVNAKAFSVGVLLSFFALVCWHSTPPRLWADQAAGGTGVRNEAAENVTTRNLDARIRNFLSILRSGSPTDLLDYWSEDGVTFGVDSDPVSKEQFRKQIERKVDVFCLLFDSGCLRSHIRQAQRRANKPASTATAYSFRELLTKAQNTTSKVVQRKKGDELFGDLRIRIENGDALRGNELNQLEFAFALEKGCWKLTSVIYD